MICTCDLGTESCEARSYSSEVREPKCKLPDHITNTENSMAGR
jgi:hypothetical protein